MNRDNPVLDAVDALTVPTRHKVMQDDHTVTVTIPALLTRLDGAIRGTIGAGGSGALKSERNLLDGDALHRFMLISSTVKEWARLAGATITPAEPAVTLRSWYVAYAAKNADDAHDRFYIKQMHGWIRQITDKLNPQRFHELPDETCPNCLAGTWFNPATKAAHAHPLIVMYNPDDGTNLVMLARGKCRSCEHEWDARELAFILEQREQESA